MTDRDALFRKLQAVFDEVFDGELQATPGLVARSSPLWSSLNHIRLITTVEEEFGVSFTSDEISKIDGVPALLAAIERRSGP